MLTREFLCVVGREMVCYVKRRDLEELEMAEFRYVEVERYTNILQVKSNPLNDSYIGILNDRNSFIFVNLNEDQDQQIESKFKLDLEQDPKELQQFVSFDFGQCEADYSRFQIYFMS